MFGSGPDGVPLDDHVFSFPPNHGDEVLSSRFAVIAWTFNIDFLNLYGVSPMYEKQFQGYDHADLLQPSLSRADDGLVFNKPWNPSYIMILAFFGGFSAGGILVLFNETRLGLGGRRFLWLVPLFFVIWLGWIAAVEFTVAESLPGFGEGEGFHNLTRAVNRLLGVFLVWLMAFSQRRRFKIFERRMLEPGSIWGPALGALVAGGLLSLVAHGILSAILESPVPGGGP